VREAKERVGGLIGSFAARGFFFSFVVLHFQASVQGDPYLEICTQRTLGAEDFLGALTLPFLWRAPLTVVALLSQYPLGVKDVKREINKKTQLLLKVLAAGLAWRPTYMLSALETLFSLIYIVTHITIHIHFYTSTIVIQSTTIAVGRRHRSAARGFSADS